MPLSDYVRVWEGQDWGTHPGKTQRFYHGFVLEFKVHDSEEEETLADTVAAALRQIEEKAYDMELAERGISRERIRHYGFAFAGKTVLIG